jgi:porin
VIKKFAVILLIVFFTATAISFASENEGDSLWPVPDYSGDLKTRPALTGDWDGRRTKMAEEGVTLSVNNVTTYQNILDGGRDEVDQIGGSLDYELHLDFQKMGLWPGAFVRLYGETQYGNFVNSRTGTITGANLDGMLPLVDDSTTTLTAAVFYQFLSKNIGLFFGKIDTLDGDLNEFAHGRGNDQFLNPNLVFNPVILRTVPVSAYGGGLIVILPGKNNILSIAALDPNGQPDEWDLGDTFEDGAVLAAEMRLEVNPFGLKGHQVFGGTYSTKEYTALTDYGRLLPLPPVNPALLKKDESWSFYYNFDQYVYTEKNDPRQGIGLFGRYGIDDKKTHLVKQFFSIGIGGRGIIPGRDKDTFGIGYFYIEQSNELPSVFDFYIDSKGAEIYYNIEVTGAIFG